VRIRELAIAFLLAMATREAFAAEPSVMPPSSAIEVPEGEAEFGAFPIYERNQPASQAVRQPSMRDPGPDTPDFPDSAFTVKPGVVYVETSMAYLSAKRPTTREYATPTLLRVGVTEKLELRFSTVGYLQENGPEGSVAGLGQFALGFKRNIWDEDEQRGIPAFGIMGVLAIPTASANLDNGAAEPFLFFNFDHTLPFDWSLNWNGGIAWLKGDDDERFVQGSLLWAFTRQWNDDFATFWHGYLTVPGFSGEEEELVTGPGFLKYLGDRVVIDASYNFGATSGSPNRFIRIGLSAAF